MQPDPGPLLVAAIAFLAFGGATFGFGVQQSRDKPLRAWELIREDGSFAKIIGTIMFLVGVFFAISLIMVLLGRPS
jgi:hypothetical protein